MLAKYIGIIGLVAGIAIGSGSVIGLTKLMKPQIKVEAPKVSVSCPECPQCPNTLGTELGKIKGKYITVELKQEYYATVNGDSLLIQKIEQAIQKEVQKVKLARCK